MATGSAGNHPETCGIDTYGHWRKATCCGCPSNSSGARRYIDLMLDTKMHFLFDDPILASTPSSRSSNQSETLENIEKKITKNRKNQIFKLSILIKSWFLEVLGMFFENMRLCTASKKYFTDHRYRFRMSPDNSRHSQWPY